jgi:hypothetical protein
VAVGARKINNAIKRKVIGKFPSLKMNTVIWWESQIERDYIYLLEIDPDVVSFFGQPFKIAYSYEGSPKRYTPDFMVTRTQKIQVVEVKPVQQALSEKNLRLFRHIAPIVDANKMEFVVVTEQMIRVQPKLNNIKLLYKYARVPLSLSNYLDCLKYFQNRVGTSIQDAMQDLTAKGVSKNILLRLLWSGFLVTDLMKPITSASLIQMSPNDCNWERLFIP